MSFDAITVEVYLSRYLGLIGDGPERKARCPRPERHAHGDRHPSFSINIEKAVGVCPVCKLSGVCHQRRHRRGDDARTVRAASDGGYRVCRFSRCRWWER